MLDDMLEDQDFMTKLEELTNGNKELETRKFALDKAVQLICQPVSADELISDAIKIESYLVNGDVSEPKDAPANGDTKQN